MLGTLISALKIALCLGLMGKDTYSIIPGFAGIDFHSVQSGGPIERPVLAATAFTRRLAFPRPGWGAWRRGLGTVCDGRLPLVLAPSRARRDTGVAVLIFQRGTESTDSHGLTGKLAAPKSPSVDTGRMPGSPTPRKGKKLAGRGCSRRALLPSALPWEY